MGHRVDKVTLIGEMKTFTMRHLFKPGADSFKALFNESIVLH